MPNANTNNITLRGTKGSPLTRAEMDTNFVELRNTIEDTLQLDEDVRLDYLKTADLDSELSTRTVDNYDWKYRNANDTITDEEAYSVDTTSGPITITLPAAPTEGTRVAFSDPTGNWETNHLTVDGNGQTVANDTQLFCDLPYYTFGLVYVNGKWIFAA